MRKSYIWVTCSSIVYPAKTPDWNLKCIIISVWLNFSMCSGWEQTLCVAGEETSGRRHDVRRAPVNWKKKAPCVSVGELDQLEARFSHVLVRFLAL